MTALDQTHLAREIDVILADRWQTRPYGTPAIPSLTRDRLARAIAAHVVETVGRIVVRVEAERDAAWAEAERLHGLLTAAGVEAGS